jgi:hypothetical protein
MFYKIFARIAFISFEINCTTLAIGYSVIRFPNIDGKQALAQW